MIVPSPALTNCSSAMLQSTAHIDCIGLDVLVSRAVSTRPVPSVSSTTLYYVPHAFATLQHETGWVAFGTARPTPPDAISQPIVELLTHDDLITSHLSRAEPETISRLKIVI